MRPKILPLKGDRPHGKYYLFFNFFMSLLTFTEYFLWIFFCKYQITKRTNFTKHTICSWNCWKNWFPFHVILFCSSQIVWMRFLSKKNFLYECCVLTWQRTMRKLLFKLYYLMYGWLDFLIDNFPVFLFIGVRNFLPVK